MNLQCYQFSFVVFSLVPGCLGAGTEKAELGGGGDFVRPSATTGQKQEFRGHAKKETEMRVKIHARKGGMSRQEGPREWKVN